MNRLQIREAVRDLLGDPTEGFWKDDELNRHIQIVSNQLARDGLAVPITENTTSLPKVQEYVLPPYFGEMRRVRWHSDLAIVGRRTLTHRPKTEIIEYSDTLVIKDTDPEYYYNDSGRIGLYPIPNKKPVFSRDLPEEDCEDWQTIDTARDPEDDRVTEIYSENVYLAIEDACNIPCSHVSLWMRRNARPVTGAFRLRIHPVGRPEYEYWYSGYINTRDLGVEPEWVHFDFTYAPVELTPDITEYEFSFILDGDFYEVPRAAYGSDGPQFAVEVIDAARFLYFQLHQFRQDIELDFYKNVVEEITSDYQDLEIPDGYHDTLVDKVLGRVLRKGGRDTNNALIYEAKAEKDVKTSRTQAILRTRGAQRQPRRRHRRGPVATYDGGLWKGNAW